MNIGEYVDDLHQQLVAAAATGGAEVQTAAERLAVALEPAMRLGLLTALSDAAAEINAELTDGTTVEVRLAGRSPSFVVTPAPEPPAEVAGRTAEDGDEDGASVSRISLRLPEALKTRAEERATTLGQSLNSWLVGAVRSALDGDPGRGFRSTSTRGPKRIQGWAR